MKITVEEQLTLDDIAERLRVDYSTVWRWIQNGQLQPVHKLGPGSIRVPASAVNAFLQARTVVKADGSVPVRHRRGYTRRAA